MPGLEQVGVRLAVTGRQDFSRELDRVRDDLGQLDRDAHDLDMTLDQVGRGFDDVARDGVDATRRLERGATDDFDRLAGEALDATGRLQRGASHDFDRLAEDATGATRRIGRDVDDLDRTMNRSVGGLATRFDTWGAAAFTQMGDMAASAFAAAFSSALEAAEVGALTSARLGLADRGMVVDLGTELIVSQVAADMQEASSILIAVDENLDRLDVISAARAVELGTGVGTLAAVLGEDPQAIALGLGNFADAFDIDIDRALDLVAHAVERGANRYGDLFETLQEYSVQLEGLGLTEDATIQMLIDAAEGPAFNLDVVADTLKEIGVRLETSDTAAMEALGALGLNTADISRRISAGGEEAREALDIVLTVIGDIDDASQRAAALAAIGGGPLENLGINEDTLALLDPMEGDLEGIATALEDMAAATSDHPGAAWSQLWDETFTDVQGGLLDLADDFANWIESPGFQAFLLDLEGVNDRIRQALGMDVMIGRQVVDLPRPGPDPLAGDLTAVTTPTMPGSGSSIASIVDTMPAVPDVLSVLPLLPSPPTPVAVSRPSPGSGGDFAGTGRAATVDRSVTIHMPGVTFQGGDADEGRARRLAERIAREVQIAGERG